MGWTQEAEKQAPDKGEKLKNGIHEVEIFKIVYGRRDGTKFFSNNNDPQILVLMRDKDGGECSSYLTLSDKAMFMMARLLKYIGANLKQMEQEGVKITDYADPAFCDANLIGRRLQVEVTKDDEKYPEVSFYGPSDTPAEPTEPAEQVEEKEEVKLPF